MGLVCRNWEVRNLMSWKFVRRKKKKKKRWVRSARLKKRKKKYNPRPGKPIQLQTQFFESGRVSGNQTRFLLGRVSGHSKPDPTRPNISPTQGDAT